jgi:predicted RNase H-like HicB family nuclease
MFTAVYIEAEDGWIVGYVEEIPGAHSQGRTLEETRENLRDALGLMLGDNREQNAEVFKGLRVLRRERIHPAI